jgi:natural product biosynthesis luciferase-like monooxygenase protein/amino acid adenylation domain-containing protein
MEGAKFADENDFDAIWIPERHFNKFGGLYPNPSVLGAAIVSSTKQIHVRGGSVVAPLHHPVRIAEEWSVVDNLSKGRIGIAFGSGFHPNDFLLAPQAFPNRKETMFESIHAIQNLWKGGSYRGPAGSGDEIEVKLLPRPYSKELPTWLATTRSPDTFAEAGELGGNVLTALLRLSVPELRERIAVYREALEKAGHDPDKGVVTVMLHTFVGPDMEYVRSRVEAPLKEYLQSHMEHTKAVSREKTDGEEIDLSPEEEATLLEHAFERYFETSSLMGTEESCLTMIQKLKEAGVDEVACLIDFGVDFESLMTSLRHLNRLRMRANGLEMPKLSESKPNLSKGLEKTGSCPLSLGQQRLWFFDQFEPNTSAYNLKLALRLKGPLQVELLEEAIQQVIGRHDVLRTRIQTEEGKPIQVEESSFDFKLSLHPLDNSALEKGELHELIREEVQQPFNLSEGPLFRISLFQESEEGHILLLVMHHIISDGWSLTLLKKEIISLYKALNEGSPPLLPDLKTDFFNFCRWQLEQNEHFETQLDYWTERLAGISPLVELPTDYPRPTRQTSNGAEARLNLPADLTTALRKIGSDNKASLFMVLLGAFQVLLHRYSGKDDIVVGVPTAGRILPEFEELVGLFINNLPMRADFSGDPIFLKFLEEVNEYALEAYAHQEVPFERLVEEFEPERDLSRTPLFQVMFAFQNFPNDEVPLSDITMEPYEVEGTTSAFDIAFYIYEVADRLSVKIQYNRDLFRESTMKRMLGNFQVLLHGISENPKQRISELPLLSDWERQQILFEWNNTDRDFDGEAFTHEMIEATVDRIGDKLAAIFPATGTLKECRLTYRELNERSNKLAHYLIGLGVGPEAIVGVCMDRGEEMLISVLGILKAGGAYLPLDATLPKERQLFMLEDSGAKILITENELTSRFEGGDYEVIDLKTIAPLIAEQNSENPGIEIEEETLAYVIYTSGSTGRPKGVEIGHGALANFLKSMLETPGLKETDRLLAITTLSFDIAALEIFLPLIAGANLVVADAQATVDGQRMQRLLSEYRISVMQGTPSTWRILLESGWTGDGTLTLLCGGEALEASLAEKLSKQCRGLWNLYGPTETTIWSSCHEMSDGGPVLIGRPIANTTMFVLDHALNPVPIGVPGDLFIGGKGLARGYRNRPDLTAKHFLEIPFDPGKTFYRTGDRARWLETGQLECFGRSDHQIKLRGYRIELGEIEAGLTAHPDVIEAAVVVRGERIEDQRLVAYVSARTPGISSEVLQDHVGKTLPEYMVPSLFVWLDKLPKTANGKIDRKSLPEVNEEMEGHRGEFAAPESSTEKAVASIWSEVLGLKQVGLQDSFFRIGGHSLTSIQLISKINRQFSLNLPVFVLFENPTLEKFSRVIESSRADDGTMPEEKKLGINKIGLGSDIRLQKIASTKTKENEKFFRGIKNRILQLIARVTPNAFRIQLHRWRGVSVGQNVGIGYDSIIETSCPWLVSIGDNSRIGMRVTIIGHFADMEGSSDNASNPTVKVEEDVWIGPSVTILPNVTIGRGSVVAAGSTVTMAVPPGTFVQGNPAKPVARCRVPLTRDVTYDDFIQNLELIEENDDSAS